jgi:hypothetical protein
MKVLIGFEESGVVRRAFAERGHDVWSIDLEPAADGSNRHIVGDIRDHLHDGWDLLAVLHPPCTRLCNSGVRWLTGEKLPRGVASREELWADLDEGAGLFSACLNAPIERIAIENPVMHKHAKARIIGYRPADQFVQPWWFGDEAFKATGLHLKNLPKLVPTNKLTPPARGTDEHKAWSKVHRASPGRNRGRDRSRTYPGIADAFADQWGGYALQVAA